MLQVIGTAGAALVGAHRYSNSNAVLVSAVELNATCSRYIRGYSKKREKRQKSDTREKKVTKGAKANTSRQQSNRRTIQLNSKSVSDWRRSSRRPSKGSMVRRYRYSSTSSTSTRRWSYLDIATGRSPRIYIMNFSNFAREASPGC